MSDAVTRPRIDDTSRDYASLRDSMLALAREKLPAWTDHSANDPGVVLIELFAAVADALFYDQDRIAAESYLETAVERRSVMHLLRLIGCELRPPRPASADLMLVFAFDDEGRDADKPVAIETGARFATQGGTGGPISFQYVRPPLRIDLRRLDTWAAVRARLDSQVLKALPAELRALKSTTPAAAKLKVYPSLPVMQVDASLAGEILGSSDGTGGQRFRLQSKPLIDGSLEVYVDEGGGRRLWQRRDSLLYSFGDDDHFIVRRDENDVAWIEFGDGRNGRRPASHARGNVTASYRVGGGLKGNVGAGAIARAITPVDRLKHVFNLGPASGGTDVESTADAVRRGPAQFRGMGRAVTAEDYEAQARTFGVAKARARATAWNRVELFVAPAGGGSPTDTLKEELRAYLEPRRMVTTEIALRDPTFRGVIIKGKLAVKPRYLREQVRQQVEDAARALWTFDAVDFECTLYLSKLYEAIEAIEGVEGIAVTQFARADRPQDLGLSGDGTLRFGFDEIPACTGITLTEVTGGIAT